MSTTKPCPSCNTESTLQGVGSASGRGHYHCPKCGAWREKNAAAAALGALGGQARANGLSPEERSQAASDAANARWMREKLKRNVIPKL